MKYRFIWTFVAGVVGAVGAATAYLVSGAYDVAADAPHWPITSYALEVMRERSVEARARDIHVPDLSLDAAISTGAAHYRAMCVDCHLAPGMSATELRAGLYPEPPDLTRVKNLDPAEAFWVIKHGIKMSGMPAWGRTHDDEAIWAMVALLQRLPSLGPDDFATMTAAMRSHDHGAHDRASTEETARGEVPAPDPGEAALPATGTTHTHASGEEHGH